MGNRRCMLFIELACKYYALEEMSLEAMLQGSYDMRINEFEAVAVIVYEKVFTGAGAVGKYVNSVLPMFDMGKGFVCCAIVWLWRVSNSIGCVPRAKRLDGVSLVD